MDEFLIFVKVGLEHVLNIHAYDHLLFLIALTVPYVAKDWKRIIILVSCFTLGHTISLLLSVFNIIMVKSDWVELLIPITIFIAALSNIIFAGKASKNGTITFIGAVTVFFGIIHGLGFATYFKSIIGGASESKLLPLLEFATGIEVAQVIDVLVSLIAAYCVQTLFRFSKRDWTLVMSSFVIGVVLPMIIESKIWIR